MGLQGTGDREVSERGVLLGCCDFLVYMHVHRMQMERLELVKKMLQQREVDHHALNSKKMEHLW